MITFCIPLMGKRAAKNWENVSLLFNRTLHSCYMQTCPEFKILIACNEKPDLMYQFDDRVEFIFVKTAVPNSQSEKMIDKGYKTQALAIRLRELGGGYAMMVDADDLVSNRLAEFVKNNPNENGFYVKTGYSYFEGDNFFKRLPKFSSGSGCIVNYAIDDLPSSFQEKATPNCDSNWCIMRKRHGGIVRACIELHRPLKPLPWKAAVYVLGTGDNHSMFGKKTKYQTRKRSFLQLFEKKYMIKDKIKSEFSADWIN